MSRVLIIGYQSPDPHYLRLLATALAAPEPIQVEQKIEAPPIEYHKLEDFNFLPAKPSKFIPSKENQPWKRNRR